MPYPRKLKSSEIYKQAIEPLDEVSPDDFCWSCSTLYKLFIICWSQDVEFGLSHSRWVLSPLVYRVNVFLWPDEFLMIYGSGTAPTGEEERCVHSCGYLTTSLCDQQARPKPRTFTANKISQRIRGDNMSTEQWGALPMPQCNFKAISEQLRPGGFMP